MCVHLAAKEGHIDVLRHLAWFGADMNARVSFLSLISHIGKLYGSLVVASAVQALLKK